MKLIILCAVAVAGFCGQAWAQLLVPSSATGQVQNISAAGQIIPQQLSTANIVYIDQVGNYNTTEINQDGVGHYVKLVTGKNSPVDNTYVNILQQGTGGKSVVVDIPTGYNNSVITFQDGAGNHNASILNLNGAGNSFNVMQSGAGAHNFTATGAPGSVNNGINVTATQTGGIGAEKTFNLNLNGSNNVTVQVEQTNPNYPGQAGMAISCGNSCGTQPWSYISR